MKLRQLQDFFPPERHRDIEALFKRFAAQHGDDVEAFVMHLHEQGLVSIETLRDILTEHEIALSPPPDPEVPLERLTQRHTLVALLGKGAMGEVFIARDPDLGRTVAVKRLDPKLIHKPAFATRFFVEAQITAQLDHPSIVPIYGVERDAEGRLSYAMKFVRGKTLKDFMDEAREAYEKGHPPDEEHSLKARIETLLPVMNAIDYAHKRGVIHRDLKPDNVMVGQYGEVLVMDWGIARPIGKRERVTSGEKVEKPRTGALVGTPSYMSPEQASGETETLDGTSDQYSLGLMLFELVTLRRAITAESSFETVVKAAAGQRAPLVHFNAKEKIARELRAVIEKATARDPDARYGSVGDFADDLRRFLRDESVLARPDNFVQRVQRWIGRNRGLALGFGFGLVMLVFVVAAFIQWRGAVALEEEREVARQREEEQRQAARKREGQLIELGNVVSEQAHKMDASLFRYEALLQGFADAAALALTAEVPADSPRVFLPDDVAKPDTAPADLREAKVYGGQKISFDYVDFALTPPLTREAASADLRRLSKLTEIMRRVQLRSKGEEAVTASRDEQRALVLDKGCPLVWVYLGTEAGIVSGYPGLWVYEAETEGETYDPRKTDWYRPAMDGSAARWTSAGVDESGLGLLMTASQAVRDPHTGVRLGVAAVDLTFPFFIDALLDIEQLASSGEAFLIDEGGLVIVRSSLKEAARNAKDYDNPSAADAKVLGEDGKALLAAAAKSPSGRLELPSGQLAIWARLQATGWLYAVIGKPDALLKASGK